MKKISAHFKLITRSLICTTFLCAACSVCDSSQESTSSSIQSNVVPNDENTANLENPDNLYAYTNSIMTDVIDHKSDSSIEITQFFKNDPTKTSSSDSSETIAYTLLTFKDFPGNPPYNLHSRRLVQKNPNAFLPQPFQQQLCNSVRTKNANMPFSIAVSPDGFLPGERVTWRLSATDGTIFKEVTLCPRPMILKDKSGKIILEAALLSIHGSVFSYFLHFPALNEVVEITSTSGGEIMKEILPLTHAVNMNYMPAVKGLKSGVSQVEVRFVKDGSSYKMKFPWGSALLDYLLTKK